MLDVSSTATVPRTRRGLMGVIEDAGATLDYVTLSLESPATSRQDFRPQQLNLLHEGTVSGIA